MFAPVHALLLHALLLHVSAVAAAPAVSGPGASDPQGADQVQVELTLDDRAADRVQAPRIVVVQDGSKTVALSDDGTVPGDTAADGIWMGAMVVRRTQYLSFTVQDGDTPLAELTAFLPSTGQASVHLRTLDGDPGVELVAEAEATTSTQSPPSSSASSGSGGVNDDRLAYVLWTAVALFAIAFAYLRSVMWRAWRDELRPVIQKLDRYLDRQNGLERGTDTDEGSQDHRGNT
ncbi:MAG: hypothetical protein GXP62_20420 [Oligoflexia bacterium]|nr:hypothetical protein [Oligoflexia bacterium]